MNASHAFPPPSRKPEPPARMALAQVEPEADDRDPPARTRVPALVGEGTRVLAVGDPGAGLTAALRDQGCDVVAVPAGAAEGRPGAEPHLPDAGRDEDDRFDVAVLVNTLEHVRDPLAALRGAGSQLRRNGYLVVQVPNVGHGNVRLALLAGRFPFAAGSAAPVRFFTYESLVALLESAGLAVGAVERDDADVDAAGDPDLVAALNRDPDARTARFVVAAYPVPWPGMGWLQQRLRKLVEQAAASDREAAAACQDLDAVNAHVRLLVEQQDAALRREADLRAKLIAAHDTLRARDHELRLTHEAAALAVRDAREQQSHAAAGDLEARLHEVRAELAELRHQAHFIIVDRDAYRARLEAFRRSLLGRAYRRARRLVGKGQ